VGLEGVGKGEGGKEGKEGVIGLGVIGVGVGCCTGTGVGAVA
tara:strand:+ start:509 stop:634 length:126 start_codon:yes stop_codon:yes gene_type:complete